MKVGINAIGLSSGSVGGMEVYFLNLIKGISRYDSENTYRVYVNHRKIREMLLPYLNHKIGIKYVSQAYTYIAGGLVLLFSNPGLMVAIARKILSRQSFAAETTGILGKVIKFGRCEMDVAHFPFSIIDPSFYNVKAPIVLTIPDIQHEYNPEFFDEATLSNRRAHYRASAERAEVIITISETSKKSLMDKFGIGSEKIVVTYPGCSEDFRRIDDRNALNVVKKKYSLRDKFLFYPAGTWPHKNHIKLLEALAILRKKHGFEEELVLTGIPQNNHRNVLDAVKRLDLEGQVRFLNFVPFADLPAIYNLASVMVFPSLFEGFGIPLVEAMNVELPIACSDLTSIPEVVGDAGLYFNPQDPADMAEKIHRLWHDGELKKSLVMRGLERVKLFDWEETARKTISAYELAYKKVNREK
jgi:glycosyltransferase involved in cell wall biosynthesis